MTRLPSILLLATLAALPFAGTAAAESCPWYCQLVNEVSECLKGSPKNLADCLLVKGSVCVSFHVGGFVLTTPHLVDQRIQFSGYGVDFMVSVINPLGHLSTTTVYYGSGVFTIDFNPGARSC